MKIFECETVNGRIFRVALANKTQEKKFFKLINDNKNKEYEKFASVKNVLNGVFDIKQFELNCNSLI